MAKTESDDEGLSTLPKPWATAVRLIGTFGLAVFLVLFYLFVMRREENERYEKMKASVDAMMEVVEKKYSLLPSDLVRRLESIYATVAALDVARVVVETREPAIDRAALVTRLRTVLVARTDSFEGFAEASGRNVSETLANKLQVSQIPERLADMAAEAWKSKSRDAIEEECRSLLMHEFTFVARAK